MVGQLEMKMVIMMVQLLDLQKVHESVMLMEINLVLM